jgi:hypothetical protein
MDAGDFFGAVVVLAIGLVVVLTLVGRNVDPLINILPQIVIGAFVLAIVIALLQGITE